MLQSRLVLSLFLTSITLIGVLAGAKIAQFQESLEAARASDSAYEAAQHAPVSADESFYATTTEEEAAAPAPDPVAPPPAAPAPKPAAPADPVTAESYLVGDLDTGKIYISKNSEEVLPFASMSKLITALVATNLYAPTTTVAITPEEADVPPDASNLLPGERFTVAELLKPMLLNSSNVAAEALGSSTDRIKFLELMSGYAWEIGMPKSFFADSTGLSPRNSGTAKGFFAMARYLYTKRPDILAITRIAHDSVASTTDHGAHEFTSIHPFVNDPRFLGGKTGHTPAAGDTMITMMKVAGHNIAIIVLKSPGNRAEDTRELISEFQSMITR